MTENPIIYVTYGMTKSASTFTYQLVEQVLSVAGHRPLRLKPPICPDRARVNFVNAIDSAFLDRVVQAAGGQSVVLKTHGPPGSGVAERLAAGEVLACASYRDPRELALALADAGERARRHSLQAFSEIETPADAMRSLDNQVEKCRAWASLPGVEAFSYNAICFDTLATIERIARQIGVDVETDRVLSRFQEAAMIGQFNKGLPLRYREMPEAEQREFLERYAAFYSSFDMETDKAIASHLAQDSKE